MRVHLLEPNVRVREQLLAVMQRAHHDVESAVDFDSAARLAAFETIPDLILIDIDDSNYEGFELLGRYRLHAGAADCLAVGLTRVFTDGGRAMVAAGFDDYIPTDGGELQFAARLEFLTRRLIQKRALEAARRGEEARQQERDTALHSLAGERSLLQTIIDSSPDVIWVKNRDLRITRVNAAAVALHHKDAPEELIGKSDDDLSPSEQAGGFQRRERAVLETGTPMIGVLEEHVREGDENVKVLSTKYPLRTPDGEIVGLAGMLRDVTDLINAEQRLAASEARFRKLIQYSSDVLLVVDLDGRINWVGPSVDRILGRTEKSPIGLSVLAFVLEEDHEAVRAVHADVKANPGQERTVLCRVRTGEDSLRTIHFSVTNLAGSEAGGIVLNGRDVTEMHEAQERVRQSQAYIRSAIESSKMATWDYDLINQRIKWSAEAAALYGLPAVATEIELADLIKMIHPNDRHLFKSESADTHLQYGYLEFDFRTIWADGSVHWLEARGKPTFREDGTPENIAGILTDIGARKEIESKLHAERAILEILMNHGPDAVFIKDRESRFVRANRTVAGHFGLDDPKDLIGKTDFDFFPRAEAEKLVAAERAVMESGVAVVNRLDRHQHGERGDVWVLTSIAPAFDQDGDVIGVVGASRDVTRYNLGDRQLAIAETRYRFVVEQIPAITSLYSIRNGDAAYEYISPQVEDMLGFTQLEYMEMWRSDPSSAFHPDDAGRVTAHRELLIATNNPGTIEFRHRIKNGGWKWIREVTSPLPGDSPGHRSWQGIMFDLTEDRALTESLEHQVAHDALTGLPNRLMLSQYFDRIMNRANRTKGSFALLFIDLDDFKSINDRQGHQMGDAALMAVADRLEHLTRTGDIVARWGGDEFVLLLADIRGHRNAREIAARVQNAFERPFILGTESITISASVGLSVYDGNGETPADMVHDADAAMYAVKQAKLGQTPKSNNHVPAFSPTGY